MKVRNNNKEVIKRITMRSLKENRMSNIFAILAIILTTFMISSIFTVGMSMVKNQAEMDRRIQGTTENVTLTAPTTEQIEKLKKDDRIESAGIMVHAGNVIKKEFEENGNVMDLMYYDKDVFKNQITPCIDRIKGSYPTQSNEIMISRLSLELLGKQGANVGDTVNVKVKLPQGEADIEFKISGIYSEFGFNHDMSHIFVSEQFLTERGCRTAENTLASIDLNSKYTDKSQEIMPTIVAPENGQEYSYGFDFEKEKQETGIATIAVIVIIVTFIMFSGYLFIYNILFITVKKHIQFYGLLKTIGTSPKQIKSIVRGQIYRLAGIGIPIGMALGMAVSFVVLPKIISTMSSDVYASAMPTDISFHPIVFIGTIAFSLLTIVLSVKRPAKTASRIAPTEALHYSGIQEVKKGKRKGLHGGKLYKLAWHNVFREKKRAVIVFLSLFMGITTFLVVQGFIDGMKVENYVNTYMPYDFEVWPAGNRKKGTDKEIAKQITEMQGIKEIRYEKESTKLFSSKEAFLASVIHEEFMAQGVTEEEAIDEEKELLSGPDEIEYNVYGIDTKCVEEYNKKAKTKIDIAAFREGKTILVHPERFGSKREFDRSKITGDTFTIKDSNHKEEASYSPVLLENECKGVPTGLGCQIGMPTVYISLEAMEKLDPDATTLVMSFNVDPKEEAAIKSSVEQIAKQYSITFEAKTTTMKTFKDGMKTLYLIGAGISLVLVLIGILNFINVMITGVYVRFKELAVMESIGMTKKQIKKMLMMEGIYYAGITSVFVGTIGMLCVRGVAELGCKMAEYAVITMPWIPYLVIVIIIIVICMVTPAFVYRIVSKQTITERLRTE